MLDKVKGHVKKLQSAFEQLGKKEPDVYELVKQGVSLDEIIEEAYKKCRKGGSLLDLWIGTAYADGSGQCRIEINGEKADVNDPEELAAYSEAFDKALKDARKSLKRDVLLASAILPLTLRLLAVEAAATATGCAGVVTCPASVTAGTAVILGTVIVGGVTYFILANKKKDDPKGDADNSGAEKETPDLSGTAQTPMPDPDQDPDDENDPNFDNAKKFEKSISHLTTNERIGIVRQKLARIASRNGWVKNKRLSKMNGRDVYRDPKTGKYYSVDTQHGHFEVLNKQGKHQGAIRIDKSPVKNSKDPSGKHDLKVK